MCMGDEDEGVVADELGRFVLLTLASAADAAGLVHLDVSRLSDLAGCSPSAVQRALRCLAASGRVERRPGEQVWVDLRAAGDATA